MTLPAHAKTWVFDVGGLESNLLFTGANDELAAQNLTLQLKQAICGHVRHGHSGSFAKSGSAITFTATSMGGHPIAVFTSDLVGKTIQIVGATTGGNNGYFAITGVTSGSILTYENASGATEAFTGSYRVLSSKWSPLPNGRSPWKCKGSGTGTTGKGSGMDAIDRWVGITDMQSSTSGAGDRSWFVFQNEVSGAEICISHLTNSAISDFERAEWHLSPNKGFTGGTSNARPTATDESLAIASTVDWLGTVTVAANMWSLNIMQSSDGYDMMFWMSTAVTERFFLFSRIPTGVAPDTTIPWNGTRNVMGARSDMTLETWSNTANTYACIDKDAAAGGPFKPAFKLAVDLASNSMLNLHFANLRNEVLNEFHVWPIGLSTATTSVRGRHARMPDMFMAGNGGAAGIPIGARLGSGAWIRLGDFILPWNATDYRRI